MDTTADPIAEPPEHRACRGNTTPERDERLRAEGRAQADNAISWNVTCVGCADRLDSLYAERVAGAVDAIRDLAAELQALAARTGDPGAREAVGVVQAYAARNSLMPTEGLGGLGRARTRTNRPDAATAT